MYMYVYIYICMTWRGNLTRVIAAEDSLFVPAFREDASEHTLERLQPRMQPCTTGVPRTLPYNRIPSMSQRYCLPLCLCIRIYYHSPLPARQRHPNSR